MGNVSMNVFTGHRTLKGNTRQAVVACNSKSTPQGKNPGKPNSLLSQNSEGSSTRKPNFQALNSTPHPPRRMRSTNHQQISSQFRKTDGNGRERQKFELFGYQGIQAEPQQATAI